MHFSEGAFWTPLFEFNMVPLQVATGCSHNRCKFCDMYKRPFAISPREEIREDIDELSKRYPHLYRVFLTGGNALALPYADYKWILEALRDTFGDKLSVGCFARITDVARRSDEELASLAALGLSDISIGAETGYAPALEAMDKGFSPQDILEQSARLDAAGISYNFFYLIGMAGAGKCLDAARATAELFSQCHPNRIMVHTMTPFRGTPLWDAIENGDFEQASEIEIIEELREFIDKADMDTLILGNHTSNAFRVNGRIPRQREDMLAAIDEGLAVADEERMRFARSMMRTI